MYRMKGKKKCPDKKQEMPSITFWIFKWIPLLQTVVGMKDSKCGTYTFWHSSTEPMRTIWLLNVTPAAASQFVTAYEKKGWVERIRSDKDRRTVHVKVTDKINRIFDERLQKIDEKADEVLADFSDEEILAFSRILKAIDGKLGITLNPQDKKK